MTNMRFRRNNLSKLILAAAMVTALVAAVLGAMPAYADMGPHPNTTITFDGVPQGGVIVTLLSADKYSGPWQWYDPSDPDSKVDMSQFSDAQYAEYCWQLFANYADKDGYYFLQRWWTLESDGQIEWGYHPPDNFKILIYFVETQTFAESDVCKTYALNSYFAVDLSDWSQAGGDLPVKVRISYDYFGEIVGLLVRLAATVVIELLLALAFRFKSRKSLVTITVTNVVTQLLLNVGLNLIDYFQGILLVLFLYLPLELLVFLAEAVTYSIVLRKEGVPAWKCFVYSLAANLVSFAAGFGLALLLPWAF